nr:unnamed protein product [Spirometra erinaceieuropaei]
MYSVVEFLNDESVAVVAKVWFYSKNCVMWLKNARRRNTLLEKNEPPPSGTKVYPVRILKDNLTLDAARRLAHRIEDMSDLSFSEPTELGQGFRTKFARRLTSDSEYDDDENIVERQPVKRLAGWPAPPPILQLNSISKKVDNIAHNQTVLLEELRQYRSLMVEKVGQIHASTVVVGQRPPTLRLPLCTKEAYEDFVGNLNDEADFRKEVMKQLASVGGCNNKEFVRNLLSKLLGPPLCLNYCWGGSMGKQSFVGSPLYALLRDLGLVGHFRIRHTEPDEPVPGAPTCTCRIRLHCPHSPHTFTHLMGLFDHMRIHESGIDHSLDTANTSCTSTMPSTTHTPSPSASAIATISETDTDIADFYCPHSPRTLASRIGLVGHLRVHAACVIRV